MQISYLNVGIERFNYFSRFVISLVVIEVEFVIADFPSISKRIRIAVRVILLIMCLLLVVVFFVYILFSFSKIVAIIVIWHILTKAFAFEVRIRRCLLIIGRWQADRRSAKYRLRSTDRGMLSNRCVIYISISWNVKLLTNNANFIISLSIYTNPLMT